MLIYVSLAIDVKIMQVDGLGCQFLLNVLFTGVSCNEGDNMSSALGKRL